MGFRDENEALRARLRSLEEENEELRLSLKRERGEVEASIPVAEPASGDDLASLLASREAEERARAERAKRDGDRRRRRAMDQLARRPRRVTATRNDGGVQIHIAPKLLRDKMWEQAGWGMGFAAINPGVFIVMGLVAVLTLGFDMGVGAAIGLAIPLWLVILLLVNLGVAAIARPSWRLTFTADGHFAMYRGKAREPTLLGRTSQLRATVPEPGPTLQSVDFGDGRRSVAIEKLAPADLEVLRAALRSARARGFGDEPERLSLSAILGAATEADEPEELDLDFVAAEPDELFADD